MSLSGRPDRPRVQYESRRMRGPSNSVSPTSRLCRPARDAGDIHSLPAAAAATHGGSPSMVRGYLGWHMAQASRRTAVVESVHASAPRGRSFPSGRASGRLDTYVSSCCAAKDEVAKLWIAALAGRGVHLIAITADWARDLRRDRRRLHTGSHVTCSWRTTVPRERHGSAGSP